jgi:glycerol-3-phosphate dehydrogenase (NAD(P)+)
VDSPERIIAGPVTIYGGGSWGSTLAIHLGRLGRRVRLWDVDALHAREMARVRENRKHVPGIPLPDSVEVLYDEEVPAPAGEAVVLAVPSHALRPLLGGIARDARPLWIVATKGLEEETCLTMRQVVEQVRGEDGGTIVVLAGPSLALEVAQGKPSALLSASVEPAAAAAVQRLFASDRFRVYTSADPLGVELATSLKNVVALAAGIADGLALGQNARGALLTRGLAEIRRLGEKLGAKPETFLGLAGVGDLVTTCTSPLSRNHTLGEALGRGRTVEEALSEIGMVVEGVRTTSAACRLAERAGVEMPIARQIYRILFEGTRPADALHELMTRPLRPE